MLINLDESIALALEKTAGVHDATITALSLCAQQCYEGNHILVSSRRIFDRILIYRNQLDRRTRAAIIRAADQITQRKYILGFAKVSINLIVDDDSAEISLKVDGDKKYINIPVQRLVASSSLISKPLLVAENLDDAHLYLKLPRDLISDDAFTHLKELRGIILRAELAPGGGQTTAQLFRWHKVNSERIGLAVTDSDVRYPGGGEGATALALRAAESESPTSPTMHIKVLASRTIENIIPRESIRVLCKAIDKQQGHRANELTHLIGNSANWHYHPVKTGVKCFELGLPSAESVYLTSIFGKRRCQLDSICPTKQACSNFTISPLSSRLLRNASEFPKPLPISHDCLVGMQSIWTELIELIYSYFCGTERTMLT